jgi:hypothetical protein
MGGGFRVVAPFLAFAAISACSVPSNMSVRSGSDPVYMDDGVLFRSTYYFRVVDRCQNHPLTAGQGVSPRIDSLYRYTMTGKANSLFNRTFFESGTLKAHEISPFGRSVGRTSDGTGIALKTFQGADTPAQLQPQATAAPNEDLCVKNRTRHGFQIFGPSGWEDFSQDERLLLVMSSDSKPLIGALKAAADRIVSFRARRVDDVAILPALILEVDRTQQSVGDLQNLRSNENPDVSAVRSKIKTLIDEFSEKPTSAAQSASNATRSAVTSGPIPDVPR